MLEHFKAEKINRSHGDLILVAIIVLLSGLGLSALFSVCYEASLRVHSDPIQMAKRQFFYFVVFGAWAFFVSRIRLDFIRHFIPLLMLFNIILLFLPLFPGLGVKINNAHRWIDLGPLGTFQPSEFCKIAVILYIAFIIDKKEREGKPEKLKFFVPLFVLIVCSLVVLLQRDISTAIFIFALGLSLIFLGGVSFFSILFVIFLALIVAILSVFKEGYSRDRFLAYWGFIEDPDGVDYQVRMALNAFNDSGLFGHGIGSNMFRNIGVPEAHSDFILPAIAKDVGYVGILFLFTIMIIFAVKGFLIAWKLREDTFSFLIANGITIALVVQFFLNVGISARMFPTTGIPLPFFSAGGSSLFVTLTMCGILVGLSSKVREEYA